MFTSVFWKKVEFKIERVDKEGKEEGNFIFIER